MFVCLVQPAPPPQQQMQYQDPNMMGMMPMGGMPQMGMGGMPAGGGGPPEGKLTGEIKNWNDEKGFGFVVPSGGGDDIFCHRTDIISTGDRPQLARGMQVSYEVGSGRDGRARATEVANVDGTPIAEGAAMQMGGGNAQRCLQPSTSYRVLTHEDWSLRRNGRRFRRRRCEATEAFVGLAVSLKCAVGQEATSTASAAADRRCLAR